MDARVTAAGRRFLLLGLVLGAVAARAQPMTEFDFHLAQFGNPGPAGGATATASDDAFRAFARQFAAAMTSVNLSPPRTLGHAGFAVNAELSVVDLGKGSLPTTAAPVGSPFPGLLLIPSLHFRKGLPWSLELGARAAWIEKSRMGVGTLELKWALNEGFTYLPDIALKGSLTKLINARDLDLLAGGVDLGIGKQFAIGGMVTITPYVGWNLLFVGASTGSVDFQGRRTQAQADAQPLAGSRAFTSLNALENTSNRFYGGFRFVAGVFQLGGEVSYTVATSFKRGAITTDVNSVLAWNSTLGLEF